VLLNVDRLAAAYCNEHREPPDPAQAASLGPSGRRGMSLAGTFTEPPVVVIRHAIAR
jgi:hypothetical protein